MTARPNYAAEMLNNRRKALMEELADIEGALEKLGSLVKKYEWTTTTKEDEECPIPQACAGPDSGFPNEMHGLTPRRFVNIETSMVFDVLGSGFSNSNISAGTDVIVYAPDHTANRVGRSLRVTTRRDFNERFRPEK